MCSVTNLPISVKKKFNIYRLPNGVVQKYNSVKLEKISIKIATQITLRVVTKVLKNVY